MPQTAAHWCGFTEQPGSDLRMAGRPSSDLPIDRVLQEPLGFSARDRPGQVDIHLKHSVTGGERIHSPV
jgi:hypothetical protein